MKNSFTESNKNCKQFGAGLQQPQCLQSQCLYRGVVGYHESECGVAEGGVAVDMDEEKSGRVTEEAAVVTRDAP